MEWLFQNLSASSSFDELGVSLTESSLQDPLGSSFQILESSSENNQQEKEIIEKSSADGRDKCPVSESKVGWMSRWYCEQDELTLFISWFDMIVLHVNWRRNRDKI